RAEQGDQLNPALDATSVEAFDQATDVVVASEIDCGILLLKGHESRVRRAARVPGEAALSIECDAGEFASQLCQPALAVQSHVERLDVRGDQGLAGWNLDHRKYRLS